MTYDCLVSVTTLLAQTGYIMQWLVNLVYIVYGQRREQIVTQTM